MEHGIIVALAAFLSVVPILTIILIRQTVKQQRREVIKDLETVFHLPVCDRRPMDIVVPSFEFVKYKYFFDRKTSEDGAISK